MSFTGRLGRLPLSIAASFFQLCRPGRVAGGHALPEHAHRDKRALGALLVCWAQCSPVLLGPARTSPAQGLNVMWPLGTIVLQS